MSMVFMDDCNCVEINANIVHFFRIEVCNVDRDMPNSRVGLHR